VREIPDDELRAARDTQRRNMVDLVNSRQQRAILDPNSLTLVWARRFAEYKRAFLFASDLSRLARLVGDATRPVQIVVAGKSHPRDEGGKRVMQSLLQQVEGEAGISARVAFVEDYNEEIARYLTAGADVWLNTPRKPLEASGTSGMKSSDNGGIQVTVTDGWAAEVDWWGIGWGISGKDDETDARDLYRYLEEGVVPTFYDRDERGTSSRWSSMMKNTMVLTLEKYSSRRMMHDYLRKLYLPLVEEQRTLAGAASR
jgi:starch phosphorylase